jgi:hypothetical protein
MSLRVILLIVGTSILLTYTTSPIALTDGIESLLSPLKVIGVPVHAFAMMMSIALRFIPTLVEETEKIMNAQKSRGADFSSGGLLKRAKRGRKIKTAVAHATVKRASSTSAKSSVNSSHKEVKKEVKTEVKTEKKVERKPTTFSTKSPSNSSATREKTEVKREKKKEEKKPILQESVHVASLIIDDKKDENSPKTSPQNASDTWIRKLMIAEINREEMAEEIKVGDTFDLALAEDKSVVLSRQNYPVATVRKADTLPLATALKLGRKLYVVVTNIKTTENMTEIEFEGWQKQ